jgi:hypothetical protein
MKLLTPFLLILMLWSCKDVELKKQSADEILKVEIKSINWKEVDFYPTFKSCKGVTSKAKSRICFEIGMKKAIHQRLKQKQIITSKATQDTLVLELFISTEGNTKLNVVKISDTISSQNPNLVSWLEEAISELPELYPAQKRSVPVSLTTGLPIILK